MSDIYQVQNGDSPTSIAANRGGHPARLCELLAANKHKPVALINGVVTFQRLYIGEKLNVPSNWPCCSSCAHGGGCAGGSNGDSKPCGGNCGGKCRKPVRNSCRNGCSGDCNCTGANNSMDYGGIRGGCGGCSSYPGNPPSAGNPPGTFPGLPGGSPGSMPGSGGGGNPGTPGYPGKNGPPSGGGNPGGSGGHPGPAPSLPGAPSGGTTGGGNSTSGGGGSASGGGNNTGGNSGGGFDTPPATPPPSGGGNSVDQPPPSPVVPISPGGGGIAPIIPKYAVVNGLRGPGLGDTSTTDPTTGVVTLPTQTIVGSAPTPTWVMPTVVGAVSAVAGFGLAYVVMRPAKSIHQITREEARRLGRRGV